MRITAVSTATSLDWKGWIQGIARAVIGGGAGSIVTAFSGVALDPTKFNVGTGGGKSLLWLMGMSFVLHGIVQLAIYLQTHPIPDPITIQAPNARNVTVNQTDGGEISVQQDKK